MGSDRLRRSYDESRRYRRVVPQQGRPYLEADPNEEQEISTEETRKIALDVVGPVGTPDNGYEVGFVGAYPPDFTVGAGTLYVGGLRVELTETVRYSAQKEWLDGPVPALSDADDEAELVVLMLAEQEVSAVEDTTLREVALGGPDTAQRTRIVQRFERFVVGATTCEEADYVAAEQFGFARGYRWNRETRQLEPHARLEVDYDLGSLDEPCKPTTQQGYLGAENDLIRVQISSAPYQSGTFLWAFEDASALYRVAGIDVDEKNQVTLLKLASPPVDAHHEPRAGQRIEILRSTVELRAGYDYMAARSGKVLVVADNYDPESQTVAVEGIFSPGGASPPMDDTPLFVRVWEDELPFTPGEPVSLGATGVRVTLSALMFGDRPDMVFGQGDYWLIGVRPSAPLDVLPNRYLEGPQPPDGPRLWACPLGIIFDNHQAGVVLDDCREPFDDLVELSVQKTCGVIVGPGDVDGGAGLQRVFDLQRRGGRVVVELRPGTYYLDEPILLDAQHSGLTVRACSGAVVIQPHPDHQDAFLRGLVELVHADDVTFEGITFRLPTGVPADEETFPSGAVFSVGLRPMFARNLTIRRCVFIVERSDLNGEQLAVAVLAGGVCDGIEMEENELRGHIKVASWGFALVPTARLYTDTSGSETLYDGGRLVPPVIAAGSFRNNRFQDVRAPILIVAYAGALRIESNHMVDCTHGITLLSIGALAMADKTMNGHLDDALEGVSGDLAVRGLIGGTIRNYVRPEVVDLARYPYPPTLPTSDLVVKDPSGAPTSDLILGYARVVAILEDEIHPFLPPVALHVVRNDISMRDNLGQFGILLWDTRFDLTSPSADGVAVVARNKVSMWGGYAGIMVVMVERVSATGNVLACRFVGDPSDEEAFHPYSLIIVRGLNEPPPPPGSNYPTYARVAVTGNVCQGPFVVPLRPPTPERILPWHMANHLES